MKSKAKQSNKRISFHEHEQVLQGEAKENCGKEVMFWWKSWKKSVFEVENCEEIQFWKKRTWKLNPFFQLASKSLIFLIQNLIYSINFSKLQSSIDHLYWIRTPKKPKKYSNSLFSIALSIRLHQRRNRYAMPGYGRLAPDRINCEKKINCATISSPKQLDFIFFSCCRNMSDCNERNKCVCSRETLYTLCMRALCTYIICHLENKIHD